MQYSMLPPRHRVHGVSLNDMLLVVPTVHSPLIDVLLHFRLHRVAMVADVSRMYQAIALLNLIETRLEKLTQ